MAFSKKGADARKAWMKAFVPGELQCGRPHRSAWMTLRFAAGTFLNMDVSEVTYRDFINKEFVLFSIAR
jgi:hypothetical protein